MLLLLKYYMIYIIMEPYTKYKYLLITKYDMKSQLFKSLRDLGDHININYSTLSRYLKLNPTYFFTHHDTDYIIKIINWD